MTVAVALPAFVQYVVVTSVVPNGLVSLDRLDQNVSPPPDAQFFVWSGLPVLFVTGYTGDATETADFLGHEVLRKPYTLAALAEALSNALNGSSHRGTAEAAE